MQVDASPIFAPSHDPYLSTRNHLPKSTPMTSLDLLLSELHAADLDAHHDYTDGEWVLIVDGEVVARAQSIGELADEGWGWLASRE